ncbi:M28 family metallopeptidase [Sphingomonas sp. VNH70]|uniref:M28 family metallopeptidase n=1 Tax=Sphingomonas silueang TaxID=3156617 RepID=UPI0032B41700
MRLLPLALLLISTAAPAQTAPPPLTPQEAAMRAHVAFLAADDMKGREPGTPEYDRAAAYVADQMRAAGLLPAGDNGTYLQKVPLASAVPNGEGRLTAPGRPALTFGTDYITPTSFRDADLKRSGEVVFVGRGVVDPAHGIDDYAGLDVKGKIVAYLYGAPATLPSEIRAHLASGDSKRATAAAKGAIGVIAIENAEQTKRYPFSYLANVWRSKRMTWVGKDGMPHVVAPTAPAVASLSATGAARLFTGSKIDWAAVVKADAAGGPTPRGATGVRVSTQQRATVTRFDSSNVVGKLPGSDPALRDQYVALSAHLDHIGISTDPTLPKDADRINNGAMDNAAGTAAMIEAAKLFAADAQRPRRSLLFVSVTAEEKGLIGSDYFAQNPTVPRGSIVGDVNLDMPILSYRFQDLVAIGADHSTVAQAVGRVAASKGLKLVPDPEPEEAIFVRSDHYSFVKAGIPAVSLDTGPGGPGAAAIADFLEHRYHQPGDDMHQTFDWTAGRMFVQINHDIALDLANADERPKWNKGDYFGVLYNGYGAK